MDKSYLGQSVVTPLHICRHWLTHSLAQSGRRWQQASWGLLPLALATGGVWCLQPLVNPPPAVAYTSRLNVFLSREQDESFDALLRRAEITARAGVQRSFDADVLTGEAIVTIVAENQGITVPLLTVEVTRAQWRSLPDVEYWGRYYETAKALLAL